MNFRSLLHWLPSGVAGQLQQKLQGQAVRRRHLIISGTGRAGTSFLVQLFTEIGLDTGFQHRDQAIFANCNAGMEYDLRDPKAPYLVKHPVLCDYLDEAISGGGIQIDHALVPVRNLFAAAESRRDVVRRWNSPHGQDSGIPGGLWDTSTPQNQETILTLKLYRLIESLAKHEIPTTLLHFPRLVMDAEYLYRKVAFALPKVRWKQFERAFRVVSRPELVHDFKKPAA